MRRSSVVRAAGLAVCVALLGVASACGLYLVEKAENDITGLDMPPSSVRIDRTGEHSYDVYLLGVGYHIDFVDELASARRAALAATSVTREGMRRAVGYMRRAIRAIMYRGGQGG